MPTLKVLDNGNLELSVTAEEREEIDWVHLLAQASDQGLHELIEHYSCNGSYGLVAPETIGAMTDAPIIAEWVDHDPESGEPRVDDKARVWWFPNYMVED